MTVAEHLDIGELVNSSVDALDLVQQLRRRVGDDPTTQINIHISAQALDYLLDLAEQALRRRLSEP